MSTTDVTMTRRATIVKELRRLAQIVISIIEVNGFGVIANFTRSYTNRTLNCGPFNIEIYLYPHLADTPPHIWITRNSNEPDNFDSLANQLRLAGFEVDIVIEQMLSKEELKCLQKET